MFGDTRILFDFVGERFENALYKGKISGHINADPGTGRQILLLYNKFDGELLSSYVWEDNGDYTIRHATVPDESLLLTRVDETGTHFAESYDRMSLCVEETEHGPEFTDRLEDAERYDLALHIPLIYKKNASLCNFNYRVSHENLYRYIPDEWEFTTLKDGRIKKDNTVLPIPRKCKNNIGHAYNSTSRTSRYNISTDGRSVKVPKNGSLLNNDPFLDGSLLAAYDFAEGIGSVKSYTQGYSGKYSSLYQGNRLRSAQAAAGDSAYFNTGVIVPRTGAARTIVVNGSFSRWSGSARATILRISDHLLVYITNYYIYAIFYYGDYSTYSNNGAYLGSSQYAWGNSQLVIIVNNGAHSFYVDGTLLFTRNLSTSVYGNPKPILEIIPGAHTDVSDLPTQYIQSVHVFDRALSISEFSKINPNDSSLLYYAPTTKINNIESVHKSISLEGACGNDRNAGLCEIDVDVDALQTPGAMAATADGDKYGLATKLGLITNAHQQNLILDMPMCNGNLGNKLARDYQYVSISGIKYYNNRIVFDGSANSFLWRGDNITTVDATSNVFDESNIDIYIKFIPNSIGAVQCIWKSGNNTTGLAVGLNTTGNVVLYSRNSGTLTSVVLTPVCIVGVIYKFVMTDGNVYLYDEFDTLLDTKVNSLTISNSTGHESVGAAITGSPVSGTTGNKEFFIGEVYDIVIAEKNTLEYKSTNPFDAITYSINGAEVNAEVVSYDFDTNSAVVWVNVPIVSPFEDTVIKAEIRRSTLCGLSGTNNAREVWGTHGIAAYHANLPSVLLDSAHGKLDGTFFGVDSSNFASGEYGTYFNLNGVDEYVQVPYPVIESMDKCSIILVYSIDTLNPCTIIDISTDSMTNRQINIELGADAKLHFSLFDSDNTIIGQIDSPTITAGAWNITGFMYNGEAAIDSIKAIHNYINSDVAAGSGKKINSGYNTPMYIGRDAADSGYMDGSISEILFLESSISGESLKLIGKSLDDTLGTYSFDGVGTVLFTIPAGTVDSFVHNVPLCLRLSDSCGIEDSDLSEFFTALTGTNGTYTGNDICRYEFGSARSGHALNYKSITQDSGPQLDPHGSLKFDGYSTCSINLENSILRTKVCVDFSLVFDGYYEFNTNSLSISSTYSGNPVFGVANSATAFSISTTGTYLAYLINDNGVSSNINVQPAVGGWNTLQVAKGTLHKGTTWTAAAILYDHCIYRAWSATYYYQPYYNYGSSTLFVGMNRGDSYRLIHKLSGIKFHDRVLDYYDLLEVYSSTLCDTPTYTGVISVDVKCADASLSGELISDCRMVDNEEPPYLYNGNSNPWNHQPNNFNLVAGAFTQYGTTPSDIQFYGVCLVKNYMYAFGYNHTNTAIRTVHRSTIDANGDLGGWSELSSVSLSEGEFYPFSSCAPMVIGPYVYLFGDIEGVSDARGLYRYDIKDNGDLANPTLIQPLGTASGSSSLLFEFNGYIYYIPWISSYDTYIGYFKILEDYTLSEMKFSSRKLGFPIGKHRGDNIVKTNRNFYLACGPSYVGSVTSPSFINSRTFREAVIDRSTGIIENFREYPTRLDTQNTTNILFSTFRAGDNAYFSPIYESESTCISPLALHSVGIVDDEVVPGYMTNTGIAMPSTMNGGSFAITSSRIYYVNPTVKYAAPSCKIYSIPFSGGKNDYTEDVYGFKRITNDIYTYQNANPHSHQKFNASQSGAILGWTVDGAFPLNIHKNGICSIRGKVFSIGGNNGSTSIVSVYSSVLDSSGSITTWVTENALPVALEDFAVLTTANRIYVIGGYTSGTNTYSDKIYTAIVANDGQLGSWELCANTLPDVLSTSSIFVNASCVYLFGGKDDNGFTDSCYRAKLNDAGELGVWTIYGKNAPYAASGNGVFVVGEFLYFCGGDTASGVTDAVYRARVLCSGELGPWNANNIPLPKKLTGAVYITSKNNLYIYGGKDDTGNPNIGSYIVDISNTIEDPISVYSTHNNGPNTYFHTNALITSSKLYFIGGHNGSTVLDNVYSVGYQGGLDSYEVMVQSKNVHVQQITGIGDPWYNQSKFNTVQTSALTGWSSAPTVLPNVLGGGTSAVIGSKVFIFGGNDAVGPSTSIYTATIDEFGDVGQFSVHSSALPVTLMKSRAFIFNGCVYLVGGFISDAYGELSNTSDIYYSKIIDGDIGVDWIRMENAIPGGFSRMAGGVVFVNDGSTLDGFTTYVYGSSVEIINGWIRLWPTASSSSGIEGANAYTTDIYSAANSRYAIRMKWKCLDSTYWFDDDNTDARNYIALIPETVDFLTTSQPWSFAQPSTYAMVCQLRSSKSNVITIGNTNYPFVYTTNKEYVIDISVNTDTGLCDLWVDSVYIGSGVTEDIPTTFRFCWHWHSFANASRAPQYYKDIEIRTMFIVSPYKPSFAYDYYSNSSCFYNGKLYIVNNKDMYIFNSSALSVYNRYTTYKLPVDNSCAVVFARRGRIYVLGGCETTECYCIRLDAMGEPVETRAQESIPVQLRKSSVVVTDTCIFVIGGLVIDSGITTVVYYSVFDSDGNLGVFGTTESIPSPRLDAIPVVTSNKMYLIGGYDGTDVLDSSISIPFSGGLNDYTEMHDVIEEETPTVDPVRFNIWYSVCIDGKTYKVVNESGSIHSIASSDSTVHGGTEGDFYYYDEPDAMWRFANTVDIQGAISKALEFPNNRMKKDKIKTNGLLVGQTIQDTTKLHIAASMDSDDTISPYVYRIEINRDQAIMISYDYPVYQYCDIITQTKWTFPVLEPFAHVWDTFLATTKVYCKLTTDTTWTLCTDESIPILPVGTVTAGKNIHFRIILDKTALDFVECAISIFVNIQ